jgi:BirA family biotin operon repressor/biotin-[acetyl-CoA-carboxylase] ligase
MTSYQNSEFQTLHFDEVESTNKLAFELIKANKAGHYDVVTANSQTNGRGRYDRKWESKKGNLYCSLILQLKNNLRITDYSFLTACAIGRAVRNYDIQTKYKWPNDILFNDEKLAGILIQYQSINNIHVLVIGVGVNIKTSPSYATSLLRCNIDKDAFLEEFLKSFHFLKAKYQQFGFLGIKDEWKSHAYRIDEKITLSDGKVGVFRDLDHDGNLLLENSDGKIEKVLSQEIV